MKNVVFANVVDGAEQVGVAVAVGVKVEVGVKVRVAVSVAVTVCVRGVSVSVGVPVSAGVPVGVEVSSLAPFSDTDTEGSDVVSPSKKPTRSRRGLGFESG